MIVSLAVIAAVSIAQPDESGGRDPEADEDSIVIGPAIDPGSRPPALLASWTTHVAAGLADRGPRDGTPRLRVGSTLALGLDWTPGHGWELALDLRLRHHLDLHDADPVAEQLDPVATVGGEFLAEIRRATLRWQVPCGPVIELGMESVRWGRTLARPFDLASPSDWREGPVGPEGADRVPTFGLSLRQAVGQGELLVRWVPFYFPARFRDRGDALAAPTQSQPAQDIWHSSELALRFTQRAGPLDLAIGWLGRFDRAVPLPTDRGADLASSPERQHVLGLELALATGPLRWAAEAALLLEQRLYLVARPDGSADGATDHAVLRWAFDVAIAPAAFFDLTLGLEGSHAPGLRGDAAARRFYEGPDDVWLRTRLGLMLAFDGVLRLDFESRVGLLRDDWWLTPALTVRAAPALTLGLGLALFGGEALDLGLGALYDRADQIWLRASYAL